jgi:predicted AAA+ superfamily ATPase
MSSYSRPLLAPLVKRLAEPRRFLQVLSGPRQSGKTTLAGQVAARLGTPTVSESADAVAPPGGEWVETHWNRARQEARGGEALLVLDEIHKVGNWSEVVKRLWDADSKSRTRVKVLLLGSSPLLVGKGPTESLAGRFEVTRVPHWSFPEMRDAFGWDLERYVRFGGYPGAAPLVSDPERWSRYVLDSLVETTVARDVLLLHRVEKPALLRRLFELGCAYSGQVLAYTKMLGQLQDAGNTTTLAHYLDLLSGAGLVAGIPKWSGARVRQRASSPKLLALNTALVTAMAGPGPLDPEARGRLVETAVGAHLVGSAAGTQVEVHYWRDRNREVDFVLRRGKRLLAVEVKSGRARTSLPGLEAFGAAFPGARRLVVGSGGVPLEEFLAAPADSWIG